MACRDGCTGSFKLMSYCLWERGTELKFDRFESKLALWESSGSKHLDQFFLGAETVIQVTSYGGKKALDRILFPSKRM